MRPLEPLRYDAAAPLARAHPLAKLGAALVLMGALFLTADPLAPALVLAALALSVPALGIAPGPLARRTLPLAVGAAGVGVFNALVAGDPALGAAVALRIAAVALAGILAHATVEPADLADALVQHARVSPRFAVGTLAAFRLLPLFAREWDRISLARRARGIEERSAARALRSLPERAHTLLVGAIRRATDLAVALDARGLGVRRCRTVMRPRGVTARDAGLLLGAVLLASAATAASIATGAWRLLLFR